MAVEFTTTTNKRFIGGENLTDGNVYGKSATDKIAFYGATPVVQPASTSQAAVTATMVTAIETTTFSEAKTGMWAFASSTVAQLFQPRVNQAVVDVGALKTLVNQLRSELVTLGLLKGST